MIALIYTHPPDYVIAALVARQFAKLGAHPVLAIDRKDPLLVVEGIEVVRTSFNRRGNLNGGEFITGNLRLMATLGERHGSRWVIKCDADTWPLSLAWLDGVEAVAAGVWTDGHMSGCCYALATATLPALVAEAVKSNPTMHAMEDHVTGEIAKQCGPVHFPERDTPGAVHFPWKPGRGLEWCEERGAQVLNFSARIPRRDVLEAMKTFTR